MSCDIHMFAEVDTGESAFQALSDGEFLLPSDYDLFAALAGVRAEQGFVPFRSPRGIPHDVSPHVADRYFVPVLDDAQAVEWCIGEHFPPAHAARLVESGQSHWLPEGTTAPLTPAPHGYIAYPDWHSTSWLTADELRMALEHAHFALTTASDEF